MATGRPFGHYRYSDKLGPRVGGVPLLAAAAWAMMSRPAWVVAGRLARRRALRVPLAAGALTAWDVFLDPRMARDGYWTWPDGGRYEGIPASNFAGWLATGLVVFAAVGAGRRRRRRRRGRRRRARAVRVDVAGREFANAVLWRRPVVAAAGGAAMGAFAAPALWRAGAPRVRVAVVGAGVGGLAAGDPARPRRAPGDRLRAGGRAGRQVRARAGAAASRGTRGRRC